MNELDAAYNLVHDYPGGAESLAPRIGKNATTLCHEVAGVGTAKLGMLTARKLSVASGDMRILEAFAGQCGFMLLPLPSALQMGKDTCMERLGEVLRESSEVVRETVTGLADGELSDNERSRIERDCGKLVSSVSAFMRAVDARHAAGKRAGQPGQRVA